jgi:LPXTG-site transpeptidase (sortase) family protein
LGGFIGPLGIQQPGGPLAGRQLASAGNPLEVVVTRLHVDSQVIPISGQSGELLPPDDPQVLGWWQEGRGVGAESGSSVITGHTVHTGGGAFDHLGDLVAGDRIRVRTNSGWIGYVVQRSRIYSTATLARDAASIFDLGGPGRLVLITCSNFNGKIYLSNSVVYAVPVTDEPFVEAPTGKPTKQPSSAPTPSYQPPPRIPYVPRSTPSHTPVPDNGPRPSSTADAGNTGPSGGVTPTEKPF